MAPGRGSASQKPKLWSKGSSGGGARFDVPRRESKTAVRLELVRYLGEGMGEGATAEVLAWTALEAAPRDGPGAEGVCGGARRLLHRSRAPAEAEEEEREHDGEQNGGEGEEDRQGYEVGRHLGRWRGRGGRGRGSKRRVRVCKLAPGGVSERHLRLEQLPKLDHNRQDRVGPLRL